MVVYKTTNKLNGKIYIGKDESNNPSYIGSGVILKKAINKYGKDNFIKEILEECNSRELLNDREIYWIDKYKSTDHTIGYNIAEGGNGGNTYFGKTDSELIEIKLKISNSLKNRVFTEDHRSKLSESASKRKGNKPCKFKGQKMEDYLGDEYSNEIKNKIRNSLKSYYKEGMPEEHRLKISASLKGNKLGPMSDEHKNNLAKSFKKRDDIKREKTIQGYIRSLDSFLNEGIDKSNYDEAKKIYRRAKYKGLDLSKYEEMVKQFKIISSERRSEANRNRYK